MGVKNKLRNVLLYFWNVDYRVCCQVNFMSKKGGVIARAISNHIRRKYNLVFAPSITLGKNLRLPHAIGIIVGDDVVIGDNCVIYQGVTLGQNRNRFPVIGNNVIIYAGAKIVGGINIGDNAIVGANSVVTKNVPPNSIVAGMPAKTIRMKTSLDIDLY